MSENKFIKHLRGEQTAKSVLELKNQRTTTSFANMPEGTSNANEVYSDSRGNATAVLKGTDNWKLNGASLVVPTDIYGDGRDVTGTYDVAGQTLWINASYTFPQPKIFTPNTKWVLKLCGNRLLSEANDTIPLTLLIKFGTTTVATKAFTIKEHAFNFSEELVVDFAESNTNNIKVTANSTMTVQVLCGDATATAQIYNGMTVFTALQRKVDSENVSSNTATFDDLETKIGDIEEQISGLGDDFVKIDGTSIMTAPLKFMAGSMRGAVGPYLNGVGFWKLDSQANLTLIATISDSQFVPTTTNATDFGSSTKKWKDLYLGGKAYIATINNKDDISVPEYGGTMVVADFSRATEGMFLRLDRDSHPIWETVTLTTSLSSLTDVTIISATNGQVLTYDGSKWVNQAVPTPTINYSINGGNYTAGTGSYAITRFSLMLQKADGTWEKPTDTSANYSQATDKTVNTNGFLLNQILYYNYTVGISGGQLTGLNRVYSKHATVPMSYSTNCGATPGWALGTWIYLVGTLGADGLFYLDTTHWWSDALPNSADGKLYIRLGPASSSTGDTVALLEDRPIFYHDGNGVKEYVVRPSDIPTVNNPTITIRQGGVDKGSFTLNQSTGDTIDLDAGGNVSVGTSIDTDIVGTPTISGSVVSNFSNTNYLVLPGVFELGDASTASFEIGASFTTSSSADSDTKAIISGRKPGSAPGDTAGVIISYADVGDQKLRAVIVNSGIQTLVGTTDLSQSTKYYVKFEYDGTDYKLWLSTDGSSYSLEASAAMSKLASKAELIVGSDGAGYVQSIDMADLYIKENGQIIYQGLDAPGLHQRVAVGHEVIKFQMPTAGNNYTWYRKYADGWVEQGGQFIATSVADGSGTAGNNTINLPITMANDRYWYSANTQVGSNGWEYSNGVILNARATTTLTLKVVAGTGNIALYWEVKGMAA